MSTFMLLLAIATFSISIGYYLSILFSIQYKKVSKNKENIKLKYKSKSPVLYLPVVFLLIATLLFTLYFFNKGITLSLSMSMVLCTIVVTILISITTTNFYIFTDYIVIRNSYIKFSEINNVSFKKGKKENSFELQIVTKYDLVSFPIETSDPKTTFKSIKSLLPKNIKVKEA